jgi:hypothetical protein
MRSALIILVATTSAVFAQQPGGPDLRPEPQGERDIYDAEAWMRVSFEDRERLFEQETRDADWAPAMDQSIEEKVAEFDRPLEQVTGTFRGIVGQQVSFLYGLGIDHQGEVYSDDDGSRYLVKLIARRRI